MGTLEKAGLVYRNLQGDVREFGMAVPRGSCLRLVADYRAAIIWRLGAVPWLYRNSEQEAVVFADFAGTSYTLHP